MTDKPYPTREDLKESYEPCCPDCGSEDMTWLRWADNGQMNECFALKCDCGYSLREDFGFRYLERAREHGNDPDKPIPVDQAWKEVAAKPGGLSDTIPVTDGVVFNPELLIEFYAE